MKALRALVCVTGTLLSIYWGVNTGITGARSVGGKTVMSIILIVIGFVITSAICAILRHIEEKIEMRRPGYKLADAAINSLYGRRASTKYDPKAEMAAKDAAFERFRSRTHNGSGGAGSDR